MSNNTLPATMVDDETEFEVERVENISTMAALNKSEIDSQIATAKAYPRSVKRFLREARQLVTLTEEIAAECTYLVPRAGKKISGPSARFAECIALSWGNCRYGARVVDEQERFVVSQGIFSDVERNVVVTYEVRRRITNREGERFNDDMITVTANAACSIAMRNATLRGIPKAIWKPLWDEAQRTARGDEKTLTERRDRMIQAFLALGVKEPELLALIEVEGREDVSLDHLLDLRSIYTALKDGDTTIDALLDRQAPTRSRVARSDLNESLAVDQESTDKPKRSRGKQQKPLASQQQQDENPSAPTPEEMQDSQS